MTSRGAKRAIWREALTIFVCVWLVTALVATRAGAQAAEEIALDWKAEPPCPDQQWARDRLRARVGAQSASNAAGFRAQAELRPAPAGFELSLTTLQGDERGERLLTGTRCDELADAAVLVIALALAQTPPPAGPTGSASPPPEEPLPPAAQPEPAVAPPKPAPQPRPPAAPPSAVAPSNRSRLGVRADGLLDVGLLPHPAFGPQLTASHQRGKFRAQLAGFWLPGQRTRRSEQGGVSVAAWAVRPSGCVRLWDGPIETEACAGFELGRMDGRGSGLAKNRDRHWLHRAAWAGLRFSVPRDGPWAVVLEPGLAIPLGRPSFVSIDPGDGHSSVLHTPTPVSGRVTLGLELRL